MVTTKAFGLQAIDLVYIDYQDGEGLRQQAREGALMGFTGRMFTKHTHMHINAHFSTLHNNLFIFQSIIGMSPFDTQTVLSYSVKQNNDYILRSNLFS